MTPDKLPAIVEAFAKKHPEVWELYNQLGQAAAKSGPLDVRSERLVKLALAVGAGRQGAVCSHVRRGLAAGLSREEMEHVTLLAITTVGWPMALAAFSWLDAECTEAASTRGS